MTVIAAILGIILFFVSRLLKKNLFYLWMFWGAVLGAVFVGMLDMWLVGHMNLLQKVAISALIFGIIDLLLRKYLEDDDHDVL